MAVVHTPVFSTPVIFTGTLERIQEELKSGPSCHGFVTLFLKERRVSLDGSVEKFVTTHTFFPRMFGSGANWEAMVGDTKWRLTIINTREGPANSSYLKSVMGRDNFALNVKSLNKHIRHVLLAEVVDDDLKTRDVEFIGAWRRLPHKPLKELRGRFGNRY